MAQIGGGDSQSTFQNLAQGIVGLSQSYLNVNGAVNAAGITVPTVLRTTGGRLCTVSVIVAGSGDGMIYDTNSTTATDRPVYVIPQTIGPVFVNFPMGYGIRVDPGTGQTVSVSYS